MPEAEEEGLIGRLKEWRQRLHAESRQIAASSSDHLSKGICFSDAEGVSHQHEGVWRHSFRRQ